jgi:hypothetical protein
MSLNEIFMLYGQPGFRRLERRCLENIIARHEAAVITVGGGIVSEAETFNLLLMNCYTVWVKASPKNTCRASSPRATCARWKAAPKPWKTCAASSLPANRCTARPISPRHHRPHAGGMPEEPPQNSRHPRPLNPPHRETTTENPMNSPEAVKPVITYDTSPEQYKHWSLACDGAIATLT